LSTTTFPEPFFYNWLFCRSFALGAFSATTGGWSELLTGAGTAQQLF
jgi:hypothetical protein